LTFKLSGELRETNPLVPGGRMYISGIKKRFTQIGGVPCLLKKGKRKNTFIAYPLFNLSQNISAGLHFSSEHERLVKSRPGGHHYNQSATITYDLQAHIYDGMWDAEQIKEDWWYLRKMDGRNIS